MSFLQRYLRSLLSTSVPVPASAPEAGGASGLPWWRRYVASLVGVPLAGAVGAGPVRRARPVRRTVLGPTGPRRVVAYARSNSTPTRRRRLPRRLGALAALGLLCWVVVALLADPPAPSHTPPRPAPSTTAPVTTGPAR
ncbi:hypothetical protein [Kitasatospora sp. NPDC101183]|uniref:hypothetical protein n=1 Tax=Kitasatospora sp. NPDC101183 TaxID=3364100 RepID=UPI00382A6FFC